MNNTVGTSALADIGIDDEGHLMSKTIEIDSDAYERLEQARRGEESVSDVIRRLVKPPKSVDDVIDLFQEAALSDETLEAIDESATRRRNIQRRGSKNLRSQI